MLTSLIILNGLLIIGLAGLLIRNYKKEKELERQQTDIKELIRRLKESEQLVRDVQLKKQQIFGVVAHDLRAPFNRIFALTQLIQASSQNLLPDQKEYLAKIHRVLVDGLNMIRNLIDFQKLESGEMEFSNELISFSSLVISVVKNFKPLAEKKNIKLQLTGVAEISIHTNKYFVQRILENILSNAIKFSPENTQVLIDVMETPLHVKVSITDEGSGISEEDQIRMYQKFQPLSEKPTGGESNTGLGLALSKLLSNEIKSELVYNSRIDQRGSCFSLTILKD